jgi:hypothetical protein
MESFDFSLAKSDQFSVRKILGIENLDGKIGQIMTRLPCLPKKCFIIII